MMLITQSMEFMFGVAMTSSAAGSVEQQPTVKSQFIQLVSHIKIKTCSHRYKLNAANFFVSGMKTQFFTTEY